MNRGGETGRFMPEEILQPYREWSDKATAFMFECHKFCEGPGRNSEDLGDWVSMVATLLSFTPDVPSVEELKGGELE